MNFKVHFITTLFNKLMSDLRNLSIKLYRIYVCYTNITLYIAFGIIRGRTWNVLPADNKALLYFTDTLQAARTHAHTHAYCKARRLPNNSSSRAGPFYSVTCINAALGTFPVTAGSAGLAALPICREAVSTRISLNL
jgi:hypothetical protein